MWHYWSRFGNTKFLALFSISRIGTNSATEMLCTKIIIYNQFPVDTSGNWCKIVITNMFYLTSKIFHLSPVVNLLLKFQNGFGDPKPLSIWFFWLISIKTKILAPESARGVEHFKCCVILGHPRILAPEQSKAGQR